VYRGGVQGDERERRQREREAEHDEALDLVSRRVRSPANGEREPSIRGSVADRGHEQSDRVRRLCCEHGAEGEVEQRVGDRRGDADRAEPRHLPGEAAPPVACEPQDAA